MPDSLYLISVLGELFPPDGYKSRGIAAYVDINWQPLTVPVYRFFNPVSGDHFYTRDANGETCLEHGYTPEGIQFYVYPRSMQIHTFRTVTMYRYFNRRTSDHRYSLLANSFSDQGYVFEGILGYVFMRPGYAETKPLYEYWKET